MRSRTCLCVGGLVSPLGKGINNRDPSGLRPSPIQGIRLQHLIQHIGQEALSNCSALWTPLLEQRQHIEQRLGHPAQLSDQTIKLQIVWGSQLEQRSYAPAFLVSEHGGAIKIISRRKWHAKAERLARLGGNLSISDWHRLAPPASFAL